MLASNVLGCRLSIVISLLLGFLFTTFLWSLWAGDLNAQPVIPKPSISPSVGALERTDSTSWPGFASIENVIVFGDSLSTTYFDASGQRPSHHVPFGNHDAKTTGGPTHGHNWIQYLQATYNQSLFKVTNFAQSNSTVERYAYKPKQQGEPASHFSNTFKEEVSLFEGEKYGERKPFDDWRNNTSLFVTWFGVSEMLQSFDKGTPLPFEAVFATYSSSFDRLYHLGARNFLILSVPPMNVTEGDKQVERLQPAVQIDEFNRRLANMREKLRKRHQGSTYFLFDAHRLWISAMYSPRGFKQLKESKNVTSHCQYFATGSRDRQDKEKSCADAQLKSFWIDQTQPSQAMHDLTASAVASSCFGEGGPVGFCSTRSDGSP